MKRMLPLVLMLLTMVLTALTGTAQETVATNYTRQNTAGAGSGESYKVTYEAGPGGKITKASYQNPTAAWQNIDVQSGDMVPAGAMMEFSAEPDAGYEIDEWIINGESRGSGFMIFPTVNAALDIKVTFKKPATHKVHFSLEGNGKIKGLYPKNGWDTEFYDGDDLPEGVLVTFFVEPDNDYEVDKWVVNGKEEAPDLDFPHILRKTLTEELTVKAILKKGTPKYNVSLGVGENGSVRGKFVDERGSNRLFFEGSNLPIQEGTELEIRAIPNLGYMVDEWHTTAENTPLVPSADDPNLCVVTVTEPMAIYVTFKEGKSGYEVNYEAGEHGTIEKAVVWLPDGATPFESGQSLPAGQRVEFTAKPDKGYEVDQWLVKKGNNEETFTGITEFQTEIEGKMDVKVTFKKGAPAQYPVSWTVEGGTLVAKYKAPESEEWTIIDNGGRVTEGTVVTLTVDPGDNEIKEWYINNALMEDLAGVNETTVTVEGETEIEVLCAPATPQPKTYKVTYSVSPKDQATLTVTDAKTKETIASGADVVEGTEITCQVTIPEGWELEKWTIGGKDYTEGAKKASITLTVDKDLEIQAVLQKKSEPQPKTYKVTYSVSPKEQATLTVTNAKTKETIASDADVVEGTEITCQLAIPEGSMWQLEKWTIGGKDYTEGAKKATITLTVDKDLEIQAVLLDHTSIETPAGTRYVVSLQDGELMIQGLTTPTPIYLYSTAGELMLSRLMETSVLSLRALPQGVYFLVVEGQVYKVIK